MRPKGFKQTSEHKKAISVGMTGEKNPKFKKALTDNEKEHLSKINIEAKAHLKDKPILEETRNKIQKTVEEKKGKKIAKFSLSTGKILNVYPTVTAATKEGVGKDTIGRHCKNEIERHFTDISWKYITKEQYDNFLNHGTL